MNSNWKTFIPMNMIGTPWNCFACDWTHKWTYDTTR